MSSQLISMYICYNTVHGGWSSWSGWTSCTQSCGSGSQERSRTCTSPPPRYGGRSCVGAARQTQTCNKQACPGKKCQKCSVTSSSACTALGSFLLPIRRFLFVYPITIGKAMSCDVFLLFDARTLADNWTNLFQILSFNYMYRPLSFLVKFLLDKDNYDLWSANRKWSVNFTVKRNRQTGRQTDRQLFVGTHVFLSLCSWRRLVWLGCLVKL